MKRRLIWMTVLAACSSDGTSSGVGLSITSATQSAAIESLPASQGDTFDIIELTMKNTGAKVPLSINPVLFSLATDQSLDYMPATAQPSTGCDPSVSVASGGTMQCEIAFEVPIGAKATTLAYDDLQGDTASVPVPTIVTTSSACPEVSGFLGSLSPTCSLCLEMANGVGGACDAQGAGYKGSCTSCSNQCSSNFATLCTCEAGCDTTSCQTLFADYMTCLDSACKVACE